MSRIIEKVKRDEFQMLIFSIFLTGLVLIPYFSSGIYRGHDLQFHLSRIDGIVQAIQDRQFPLAIYPYKNFGYGYASPLFYSDLFLIVPAVIYHLLGLNIVTVYKMVVAFFVGWTSFSIMYFTNKISKSKKSSFLAAVVVLFSNYYLTDIYVRCALGEIMAFSFLPLLFWNIYRFLYLDEKNSILLGLSFSLVLYSHIITFVLCVVAFGVLLIINMKTILKKEKILCLINAVLLGVLLSFSFLAPMLEQYFAQVLNIHRVDSSLMQMTALSLSELITDICVQFQFNWQNIAGLDRMDEAKTIGTIVLLLPFLYFICPKKSKGITQYLCIAALYVACSTELIPLYQIKVLDFVQFPSRFFLVSLVLFGFVISYSLKELRIKKRFILFIMLLCLLNASFLFMIVTNKQRSYIIEENVTAYELFDERIHAKTTASATNRVELMNGEYLPYTYEMNYATAGSCIAYADYTTALCEYKRNGSKFEFEDYFSERSSLLLPVSWYPGYVAYEINEEKEVIREITLTYELYSKRVMVDVDEGYHRYCVKYKGTKIQKFSFIVSFIALILVFYSKFREVKNS